MTGITVGSVAAELATDLENPVQPLTAMIMYGLAAYLVSLITVKSIKLRKMLNGGATVIMDHGKLYRANLAAAHIEMNEFITMCRSQGYFDLSQIETAILEHNGTVSILPKSKYKTFTPADAGMEPPPERPWINVIIDGKIMTDKLSLAGVNEVWLRGKLAEQNLGTPDDIELACVDQQKNLQVYPMIREKFKVDWFE